MSTLGNLAWFGRYRLTSRIATGGMAEVYVGRHVSEDGKFGPMVAVKRLLPHLVKDGQIVQMFLNEARITAQINHPNVVKVFELGHEFGEPFIAMELLDGRSFDDLRTAAASQGKRVPLGITLRILTEACRGLDAAHRAVDEQGRPLCIVHRDFTPDNIHVGVNGAVKVIDFGIAKAQHLGANTEPGTLKGKFFYMSPEMILGRAVDHRADLFAAGVMLYEQLCGRRPFTGTTTDEVVMRIAQGTPKRPVEFDPSVPPELEEICLRALRRNPEERFPSLSEFIDAIEAIGGSAQLATAEQLGAYVAELFPAEADPQRRTLRRARQADPSIPSGRFSDADGAAQSAEEQPAAPAAKQPSVSKKGSASIKPSPAAAASARPLKKILVAAGITLVLASAVTAFLLRPTLSPGERLSTARATADSGARENVLLPLANDPAATGEQLAQAASLLFETGSFATALELASSLAERFPKQLRGHLLEARAAMRLRLGKRAEAALSRAAALAPGDPQADLLLAELREIQGDLPGALEALQRAAKKRPNDLALAARRGYLLSQAGRLDEAADELGAVLQRRFDASSAAELGFVRFRQEQLDEALTLLRRALKKEPQLASAHYYLGAVLYRRGDIAGASNSYLEADRLAPTDPRSLLALCIVKAQTRAADLPAVRSKLSERFPKEAPSLLGQCAP